MAPAQAHGCCREKPKSSALRESDLFGIVLHLFGIVLLSATGATAAVTAVEDRELQSTR